MNNNKLYERTTKLYNKDMMNHITVNAPESINLILNKL